MSEIARNIFIADDDPDDRLLFTEAAKEVDSRLTITEATDGKKAYEMLLKMDTLPDVIVLDINMPIVNGLDCLQLIRKDKKLQSLPVIMMSTSKEAKTIDKSFEFGANYYTPKPATFSELKRTIASIQKLDGTIKRSKDRKSHVETFLIGL